MLLKEQHVKKLSSRETGFLFTKKITDFGRKLELYKS